ncbi:WhiB family transcriptional regulator [Streptomyces sp. NPDC059649]|uniref:WhiB family transcriptional regulator n=1 Tax=Streptomyces sp. NPDC059649 TaxID=3346895 RepID=UPI0036C9FD6C
MSARNWRDQALCAQIDPDLFAPDVCNAATVREPKVTCGKCPVETRCLEEALVEEQGLPPHMRCGIRGGKTPRERAAIDKTRRRPAAA